jgi:hypothetical protein
MRTRRLIGLALFSCLILALSGCEGFGFIVGTGAIVDKVYDYQGFDEVEISSNFQFEISQSSVYRISISTHENIIDHLDIVQAGKTLQVKSKSGSYTNTDVKATIAMPALGRLAISGASRGSAKGFKSNADFQASASGASQVDLDIEAGTTIFDISGASKISGILKAADTRISISGASRCEVSGTAASTHIDVSGVSHFESPDFQMQNTNITVSGASDAQVYTLGDLSIHATGASKVNYSGSPNLKDIEVSGASKINKN